MISQDGYFISLTLISVLLAIVLLILLSRYRRDNTRLRETEGKLRQNEQELQSTLAATKRQAHEMELLDHVREAIAGELDLPALFHTVVEATARTFESYGYTHVSLFLIEGDEVLLQHQIGYDLPTMGRLPLYEGVMGEVVRSGEPLLLEEAKMHPAFRHGFGAPEIISEVCIPLKDEGKVVGAFNLETTKGFTLTEADLLLMTALGTHINLAIERVRLFSEARQSEQKYRKQFDAANRQAQELRLLDQVRTALHREIDLPELMQTIVEAIADTFGYTLVSIYIVEGDDLVMQHQVGYQTHISRFPLNETGGIMRRVLRRGEPYYIENVHDDPDFIGAIEDLVSEVCVPVFDEGTVVGVLNVESTQGVVLTQQDLMLMTALSDHMNIAITRARLYTEARENEQKYRSVVENIDEIIFQLDKESRLIFLNPAWTEVTGYSITETLGTNIALYVYPDDRLRHQDFMAMDQMNGHESYRAEFRYVTKDGETRWVEIRTRLLEDAEGQASSLFGSINDITERKRMDEERLRLSKLEAIGPLAGGIAHDFNNLLTGIVGHIAYAELLITPETNTEMAPRLQMAERATMEARKLTHQLLTFAKGGAPVKQITSIRTVIYEAAMFISSGSNVRCDFDIEENLWPCDVDSGQIGQVIQNLIINAQQAMPDGGVVMITARNLSSVPDPALSLNPGPYVSVDIKDGGMGISPEYQQKIFDPYFTTKEEGSGLGLATAYSIMTGHDGAIILVSEINVGTTFTIYLPATPEHAVALDENHQSYVFGEGRVLVMEDEEIVRNLLGETLTHCGYTSTLTSDGEAAVQAYREAFEADEPYKAIIMDLTVPGGMGGKEAIQAILEIDPAARAIVASGYSNDPVLANYQDYGFLDRVQKPYRAPVLSKVLNDLITADNMA